MSVQEAFRNMFMRISDYFLDMVAQIAAVQIQKGFLGLFANVFGSGLGGGNVFKGFNQGPAGEVTMANFNRANGGPVKGGNSYIVGERGPELFSPGVSGMITPNHALGGSTNVVVNVDAANTTAQGDNGQAEMLGKMLAGAVQDELLKQQRPGGILYR